MVQELFYEYFVKPIVDPSLQGYNPVNTLVYGALLLIMAFYVIYPRLKNMEIKFDKQFALSLIPFILIGISLRAITSAKLLYPLIQKTANPFELGFWTFTPGVWILVSVLTILGLLVSRKSENFHKTFRVFGLIFALPLLLFNFFNFTEWTGFLGIILLSVLVTYGTKWVVKFLLKKELLNSLLNRLVLTGQVLDGTATFIAVSFYSFGEQHFVSNAILSLNPALFVFVKILLIVLILHYIDKEVEDENFKGFLKIFLIILGFATGGASLIKVGLI